MFQKIDPYLNECSIDIYEISCFMISGSVTLLSLSTAHSCPHSFTQSMSSQSWKANPWRLRLICMEVLLCSEWPSTPQSYLLPLKILPVCHESIMRAIIRRSGNSNDEWIKRSSVPAIVCQQCFGVWIKQGHKNSYRDLKAQRWPKKQRFAHHLKGMLLV